MRAQFLAQPTSKKNQVGPITETSQATRGSPDATESFECLGVDESLLVAGESSLSSPPLTRVPVISSEGFDDGEFQLCSSFSWLKVETLGWITFRQGKRAGEYRLRLERAMGFFVTTLIFVVIGIIASLYAKICCNSGPSKNLFHITLIMTATVCCWMMWAIVYLAQLNPLIVPVLNGE
ncbi:hypothetical protein Dimus_014488 [Dionaea muscipula]